MQVQRITRQIHVHDISGMYDYSAAKRIALANDLNAFLSDRNIQFLGLLVKRILYLLFRFGGVAVARGFVFHGVLELIGVEICWCYFKCGIQAAHDYKHTQKHF